MSPQQYLLIAVLFALALPRNAAAQLANDFFQQNCAICHTIGGGRLIGPDLKDVTKQKDREWLEHFMQNPKAALDAGDPFALQLQREARGIVMPTFPDLTPAMADSLLDFIEAESKLPRSRFGGVSAPELPFTPADVRTGTQIFDGSRKLQNGGPPCISCHTLGTLSGLGGGRLGPDLTLVYDRLGDRKAVGSWLSGPPTTTMRAVFGQHSLRPEEITSLLAVFEDASQRSRPADLASQLHFFLVGFAGAGLGLALMGWVWRGRIRSVRRSLVQAAQRGAE